MGGVIDRAGTVHDGHPAAEFLVTTRFTEVSGHQFKTEGKVMTNPGWMAVYGKDLGDDKDGANLVPVAKGEKVLTDKITANGLVTKPPARYNEATLLSAMEGAGKLVDSDELRLKRAALTPGQR